MSRTTRTSLREVVPGTIPDFVQQRENDGSANVDVNLAPFKGYTAITSLIRDKDLETAGTLMEDLALGRLNFPHLDHDRDGAAIRRLVGVMQRRMMATVPPVQPSTDKAILQLLTMVHPDKFQTKGVCTHYAAIAVQEVSCHPQS